MSTVIAKNMVVSMHYKLTDDNGIVLDNSEGAEPLNYLHGLGQIIPGLESALEGKTTGDKLQVKVSAEDGYGPVEPEMVQEVEKSAFDGVDDIQVGMTFQAEAEDGVVQPIVVTAVNGDKVTVDANHPLAGVNLNFDVEIVSVREASAEEIDHGHVH